MGSNLYWRRCGYTCGLWKKIPEFLSELPLKGISDWKELYAKADMVKELITLLEVNHVLEGGDEIKGLSYARRCSRCGRYTAEEREALLPWSNNKHKYMQHTGNE